MKSLISHFATLTLLLVFTSCQGQTKQTKKDFAVQKTTQEWKSKLTASEYSVLRKSATEQPFTGKYNLHFENGVYRCTGCGAPLFKSTTKFKSDCGWPSFDNAIEGAIFRRPDNSHGMRRTEILCATCGSHLGHVFKDGPTKSGLRYCINSVALDFAKKENKAK